MHSLHIHNAVNSKQISPEHELRGLSFNFHIHVSVSDLYIPTIGLPILLQENMWTKYINRSQTHECGNWAWGPANPFLGLHKWDFRCSAWLKNFLFRPAESGTNLSLWLAKESQPSQAAPVRQSGSGRPFSRPVTGPTSLLALWSSAKPVSAASAPPLGVSRSSPERSAQLPAVESRDSSRWLLSPAATVQAPPAAAVVEPSVRSLWLPQVAGGSAAAAGPANLMANWSWQPPSPSSGVDISVAELSLMSPPPPSYAAWLAGNSAERSVRRRGSQETCSESSEIMILDTPDENIDFPDDME